MLRLPRPKYRCSGLLGWCSELASPDILDGAPLLAAASADDVAAFDNALDRSVSDRIRGGRRAVIDVGDKDRFASVLSGEPKLPPVNRPEVGTCTDCISSNDDCTAVYFRDKRSYFLFSSASFSRLIVSNFCTSGDL